MAKLNQVRQKKIKIQLDKERSLLFDLNAFAELEEKYGTIQGAMEAMETGSIKAIRCILWSGLLHEDETLTERQVGSLVTLDNIEELGKSIGQALAAASPEIPKGKN